MIDFALVVVSIVLLLALVMCAWLAFSRAALATRLTQAESARAAGEANLSRALEAEAKAERQLAAQTAELASLQSSIRELTAEASSLSTQVEQLEIRRREDLGALQRQHEAHLAAQSQRHADQLQGVQAMAEQKLSSAEAAAGRTALALAQAEQQFKAVFASLAGEALKSASGQFLQQASSTLQQQQAQLATRAQGEIDLKHQAFTSLAQQMAERLNKTGEKLDALDRLVNQQSSTIAERLRTVDASSAQLREETARLVKALREPQVRGRYGEVQLRRVAELAGMRAYCDFAEQETTIDEHGDAKRPDMIVKLPNGRQLVVDAKANLKPYIDALEAATPEEAERHLRAFADGVVAQSKKLAAKDYWKDYRGSPEFVVMFVPGDQFMDAALQRRPDLLEAASQHRVILASPATLIAMLQAVAVGFREQRLSETAREIGEHVKVLRDRLAIMLAHFQRVGERLTGAVGAYNDVLGSYERRVRPQLEKIARADGTLGDESARDDRALELKPVEAQARTGAGLFGAPGAEGADAPPPGDAR
jgi:DNA recombination protein RmuC